jgi:hypothetical protein
MTSPASFDSHSKRSRLIPSGRIAMDSQPSSAASYAPPRQKLPVDGQTAFCRVGSNWPVTSLGTRQPKVAPTLCAPVGNHLPTSAMMRAGTPVSEDGSSTQLTPSNPPPDATGSFFHVMRKRLAESTSHRPTFFSRVLMRSGAFVGSFICAKVGMTMLRSRARCTLRRSCSGWTDKSSILICLLVWPLALGPWPTAICQMSDIF